MKGRGKGFNLFYLSFSSHALLETTSVSYFHFCCPSLPRLACDAAATDDDKEHVPDVLLTISGVRMCTWACRASLGCIDFEFQSAKTCARVYLYVSPGGRLFTPLSFPVSGQDLFFRLNQSGARVSSRPNENPFSARDGFGGTASRGGYRVVCRENRNRRTSAEALCEPDLCAESLGEESFWTVGVERGISE